MTQNYNAVSWFEIPVSDMPRARRFYEYMLHYSLSDQQMGPMEMAWFRPNQVRLERAVRS